MSDFLTDGAWGVGVATVAADGTVLDVWFTRLGLGEAPTGAVAPELERFPDRTEPQFYALPATTTGGHPGRRIWSTSSWSGPLDDTAGPGPNAVEPSSAVHRPPASSTMSRGAAMSHRAIPFGPQAAQARIASSTSVRAITGLSAMGLKVRTPLISRRVSAGRPPCSTRGWI